MREELGKADVLLRWIGAEEIQSYAGGTFESRVEADGGRRGYKAFSIARNVYSQTRPVAVTVPINGDVRRVVEPAVYTSLPRPLDASEERAGDAKHLECAIETECRVPDGTRLPHGTKMAVDLKLCSATDAEQLSSCDSLSGVDGSFV